MAIYINDEINLARIGTHDVEAFFGMIRNLSFNNDTFDNAVNAAVRSIIVYDLCEKLNFKINIRTRDNEGGANLCKEILFSECTNTDFLLILNSLFLHMRSK